jgi:hypothetical protein
MERFNSSRVPPNIRLSEHFSLYGLHQRPSPKTRFGSADLGRIFLVQIFVYVASRYNTCSWYLMFTGIGFMYMYLFIFMSINTFMFMFIYGYIYCTCTCRCTHPMSMSMSMLMPVFILRTFIGTRTYSCSTTLSVDFENIESTKRLFAFKAKFQRDHPTTMLLMSKRQLWAFQVIYIYFRLYI